MIDLNCADGRVVLNGHSFIYIFVDNSEPWYVQISGIHWRFYIRAFNNPF